MTTDTGHRERLPSTGPPVRLVMADRGDPLVTALTGAMGERFDIVAQLDTELSPAERLLVAAATFRPARRPWVERFYKSNLAVDLRSRRARSLLRAADPRADVVFQTHALFELTDPRTVLYVDCTHRQSMAQWPAWNPLRGPALRRWLHREARQYREAAHVFAFSRETAASLVEEYAVPHERVSVVGAGVNFEPEPVVDVANEPRPERPPTVLFVGNDFERKGGPQLLTAFEELRQRVPSARLRVVGSVRPVAGQPGVEFLGRVGDRTRLSRLYADADVFCLPSLYDPFPGALLEAMAHGLPCVVTTTCGVPEIIGHLETALTVRRGAAMVTDLTDALERLLTDPAAAAQLGERGRRRVESRFRWSHVVARMAPALERVTSEAAAP